MNDIRKIERKKTIALVVQDEYKGELITWAYYNREKLRNHRLVATGSIADTLSGTLNAPVRKLADGALGGNEQLKEMMLNCEIDMLIFFNDPLETGSFYEEVKMLQATAETCNMVIGTNRVTADFIINSPFMNTEHHGYPKDDSGYQRRKLMYSNN